MLFAVLLRCYLHEGMGARITSPISRHIIECFSTQFVDDSDLYVWLPGQKGALEVFREMQASVLMWGNLLCVSGGALKPEKCY